MKGRFRLVRLRPRTLRSRLALFSALAAFGCLSVASVVVFAAAARLLGQQAETQLRQVASIVNPMVMTRSGADLQQFCASLQAATARRADLEALAGSAGLTRGEVVAELVRPDGSTCSALGGTGIHQLTGAGLGWGRLFGTSLPQGVGDHGEHLLVLDRPLIAGWHLRIARDFSRDLEVVFALRGVMFVLSIAGGLAALAAGQVIARRGLRPVAALTDAAELIARTQDLSVRIDVPDLGDRDEVTRLARAFDRMTSALATSRARQAQLVADAGHELRTPLTSLRANVDLLLRAERSGRALPAEQREALFEDVRSQLAELSLLAGELTVLAQEDPSPVLGPVRLDDVVLGAVQRIRPRAGGRVIDVAVEPWELASADAAALERALVNVLDNAVKFAPDGSAVRVRLSDGEVTVDDEGPGVPEEHRAEAFARFWRGDRARGLPGSGLGLSIVADTVGRHGGTAEVDAAPGGGARVRLRLPGSRPLTPGAAAAL
jgi:two-component system sensor histidine kinase MprB